VDILTDLDISKLIAYHEKHKPLISFAVSNRKTSRNFLFDKQDRLCGWVNTVTGEQRISVDSTNLIQKGYSCVVVFEYDVFRLMPFTGKATFTAGTSLPEIAELNIGHYMLGEAIFVGIGETVRAMRAAMERGRKTLQGAPTP